MDTNNEFDSFVATFLSSTVVIKDGYACIEINDDVAPDIFLSWLRKFGISADTDINVNEKEFAFSIGVSSFRDNSFIYPSMNSLWRESCALLKVPTSFLVLKEQVSSLFECEEISSIRQFVTWRAVLKEIQSYEFSNKIIWYLPGDDGGKEIVVGVHENYARAKDIAFSQSSLSSANKLLSVMELKDAQEGERKLILKKAVSDFVGDNGSIDDVISAGERVYNRYNDLLDLYTKRFSVNKILSEIESKNLEYTTKINDFISSSQSKAFTIPGALIAVGALAKTSGFWEGTLVLIGLWMIHYITRTSNDVHRESYENLKLGLGEAFDRYNQFDEGAEVRKAAKRTLKSLNSKIDTAGTRLNNIDNLGRAMIVIGLLYLVLK
ncbi:hypothetical protein [Serratia liquefaciens]|uniref:hypothetical protein n=1 Tax=Serratia liquefaciens TaxID=614 RepID=UPI0003583955|nr:hypothetical protein [Serratia liquefaciens]AGQ29851.1 hypothetical protein M495_05145 [Serratia liquefaciens ATCC 27592]CAI0962243.1 Uncharacterised protein [Serratia liquefaciens]CAI2107480.1 Uncharacterised protein [Serratia liquefaciens]CAI2459815.1 Uncharacterised protein [Serratia liquefaciens]HEJ7997807.1 hypothetical protein [Serratia liquefaciens]